MSISLALGWELSVPHMVWENLSTLTSDILSEVSYLSKYVTGVEMSGENKSYVR